ncbi:MAG: ABC transporter substrate-binding protein [Ilumatobacteraceae bacterium]
MSRRTLLAAAGVAVAGALVAACGSDSKTTSTTAAPGTTASPGTTAAPGTTTATPATTAAAGTTAAPGTTAAAGTTAPAATSGGGADVGTVSIGLNEAPTAGKAYDALKAALDSTGIKVEINGVDHNTFQGNITNYLAQPEDVFTWFSGYRMRFFADKGLIGDVSDVWANLPDMAASFKTASTGNDGKQYFVPLYYYPWAVHYRKSVFAEHGYTIPTTKVELVALATKMKADGLIPFAYANDGKWPVQGTFDILNMRINGYQYHVDLLAGKESWTDARTKAVFTTWAELLPFHQENPNGRKWEEAATALEKKEAGMFYLGTFVAQNSKDQAYLDDLDFFAYPTLDPKIGADAVDAPIDGMMMAAEPKNPKGAKALLTAWGQAKTFDAFNKVNPSYVGVNGKADASAYNAIQKKSAELVGSAKHIAQFLDRDTNPDFVNNVIGDAFASFHTDPTQVDSILANIDKQKSAYL